MHQHIAPVKISLLSHLATQSWLGASIDSATARALCCSWMCIINTVRANSTESPIISRGKLYVNAPLMASFVNGIVVQGPRDRTVPRARFDSLEHAASSARVVIQQSRGHSFLYCLFLSNMYVRLYTHTHTHTHTPIHLSLIHVHVYARFLEKSR